MTAVAVLHNAGVARDRLRRAVSMENAAGAKYRLEFCADWTRLSQWLNKPGLQTSLIILDIYDAGKFGIVQLRRLRHAHPAIPIIVYSDFTNHRAQDVMMIAQLGVARVITAELDDHPTEIGVALLQADGAPRRRLLDRLRDLLAPEAVGIVLELYDAITDELGPNGLDPRGISEVALELLAATLGVRADQRRTIERKMAQLGLPSPAKLILMLRLLHIGRLLDDPGRTIMNIAMNSGYETVNFMYRQLKHEMGQTPAQLRAAGAFEAILSNLLAAITSVRRA